MSAPSSVPTVPLDAAAVGEALAAMRGHAPLVQCLTNVVVAQWTANVLLAVGASPSMVDNPEEAGPFAAVADGVLVNLGTPQEATVAAMHGAVSAAAAALTAPCIAATVASWGVPRLTRTPSATAANGPASSGLSTIDGLAPTASRTFAVH